MNQKLSLGLCSAGNNMLPLTNCRQRKKPTANAALRGKALQGVRKGSERSMKSSEKGSGRSTRGSEKDSDRSRRGSENGLTLVPGSRQERHTCGARGVGRGAYCGCEANFGRSCATTSETVHLSEIRGEWGHCFGGQSIFALPLDEAEESGCLERAERPGGMIAFQQGPQPPGVESLRR